MADKLKTCPYCGKKHNRQRKLCSNCSVKKDKVHQLWLECQKQKKILEK